MNRRSQYGDKGLSTTYGIPSALRRYAKRYGVSVEEIIMQDKRHDPQRIRRITAAATKG